MANDGDDYHDGVKNGDDYSTSAVAGKVEQSCDGSASLYSGYSIPDAGGSHAIFSPAVYATPDQDDSASKSEILDYLCNFVDVSTTTPNRGGLFWNRGQ